jgi:polar amino acid transport system permease protein
MVLTIVSILAQYHEALFQGLLVTLALSAIVWACGIGCGITFGALAHKAAGGTESFLQYASFLVTSIPLLVLLYWLYYPLQSILGIAISPFITAAFTLSLVNTIFVAQIVKNVLDEFPREYAIAGRVCGMSARDIFLRIEFPIILRQIIPQLLTLQVTMLQMTVFASLISVEELFRKVQEINAMIYKPIELYTTLALFFIAICLPLNWLAHHLKVRYTRNVSEA